MFALGFPTIDPVALELGPVVIRWYSLAYVAGILLGWRYIIILTAKINNGVERIHIDDFIIWATLGIILGGRLGYVIFYNPVFYFLCYFLFIIIIISVLFSESLTTEELKSLQDYKNVNLILGGQAKEDNFISFINQKDKINKIYLIGKSSNAIFQQLGSSIDCEIFDKLENALKKIFLDSASKKKLLTILFSPACTSFDQFKDFEERGNHFKNTVFSLVHE